MIGMMLQRRTTVGLVLASLVAAAIAAVVFLPRSASATGRSEVRPFASVPLSPVMRRGVEDLAERAGIASDRLQEVSSVGEQGSRAGVLVGRDGTGTQLVAFLTPHGVSDFARGEEMIAAQGQLVLTIGIEPAPDQSTGHVHTMAVAGPRIAKVTVDLADRPTIDIELVRVGHVPYSVFAYASDDPNTFPQVIHAYARDGTEIVTRDVAADIAPPLPQQP
jgi:hypothetical protein